MIKLTRENFHGACARPSPLSLRVPLAPVPSYLLLMSYRFSSKPSRPRLDEIFISSSLISIQLFPFETRSDANSPSPTHRATIINIERCINRARAQDDERASVRRSKLIVDRILGSSRGKVSRVSRAFREI